MKHFLPYRAVVSARYRMLLQYRAAAFAGLVTQCFWGATAIPGGRETPITTPTSQFTFRKQSCDNIPLMEAM